MKQNDHDISDRKPIRNIRTENPQQQAIHDVAVKRQDDFKDVVVNASKSVIDDATYAELERGFASGNLTRVEEAFDWDKFGVMLLFSEVSYRQTMEDTGRALAKVVPQLREVNPDLLQPRPDQWIRERGAELVTNISNSTRLALRSSIREYHKMGVHPYASAREIGNMVGMNQRQATASVNLRNRLVAQGVPQAEVIRRVQDYNERAIEYRGEVIGRTESLKASNHAQQEMTMQAVERGLINPNLTRKEWMATLDDRVSEECEEAHGQQVRINEPFDHPLGLFDEPPAFPNCRCTTILVFLDEQ